MIRTDSFRALRLSLIITLAALSGVTEAANDDDSLAGDSTEAYPHISGEANVSGQHATGNTESTSLDLGAAMQIEYAVWRHSVELSAYQAEEDGNEIADRHRLAGQSDYRFSQRSYLFGRGSLERQRFGAFDRRASVSFGVGRRFVDTARVNLDLGIGAGRRYTDPVGSDRTEYETIGRASGELAWRYSDHGKLTQSLEVESGDTNTFTRSTTALKSRLVGALAWRISHTVEHNSKVPPGVEETDTFTSVGLSYSF